MVCKLESRDSFGWVVAFNGGCAADVDDLAVSTGIRPLWTPN